jgi:predicted N-acetyltransferase YhbS
MDCIAAPSDELDETAIRQIIALKQKVWPNDIPVETHLEQYRGRFLTRSNRRTYTVESEGRLLAHAELFGRTIEAGGTQVMVGAIAGVCVDPECQGSGIGRELTQAIFNDLPQQNYPLILFQTNVPRFYEKLGARVVHNTFIRGRGDSTNPWRDDAVMIYPAHAPWPEGTINMMGEGY